MEEVGGDAEVIHVSDGDDPTDTATTEKRLVVTPSQERDGAADEERQEGGLLKDEETRDVTQGKHVSSNDSRGEHKSGTEKSSLYQDGEQLLRDGQTDEALHCFLATLKGLTESSTFHELPQCLHQISDIYFLKNEYEKAVYFVQAEKMYYETALIDLLAFQQQVANKKKQKEAEDASAGDAQEAGDKEEEEEEEEEEHIDDTAAACSPEVAKANEFENLANLCLREGKSQLAMEYCGKATKLFREVYGDEHPRTIKALDVFTCIYADIGKNLYKDAMQRFDDDTTEKRESSETSSGESCGVRIRRKKKVRFSDVTVMQDSEPELSRELDPTPHPLEQDDWVLTCLLMIVFFLVTILISLIGSYFYCSNNIDSPFCAELRGDMTYWYMKMRHLYHYYMKGGRQ